MMPKGKIVKRGSLVISVLGLIAMLVFDFYANKTYSFIATIICCLGIIVYGILELASQKKD